MAGAAVIVSLQQLKSLLGITNFTKQMAIVPVLSSVFHRTNEVTTVFLTLSYVLLYVNVTDNYTLIFLSWHYIKLNLSLVFSFLEQIQRIVFVCVFSTFGL